MPETELTETLNETTPLAEEQQQQAPKTKKAKTTPTTPAKPKPKKVANDDSEQPSSTQSTIQSTQPKAKRGPARPHRRLAAEVIDTRITKLQKRLDRAKSQIEDAARHVEGYLRERDFRAKEMSAEIQVAA
jgi:hypothetical protein